jgi:hypothetical protein
LRWLGFLVGLALLASAIWAVRTQHGSLAEVPATIREGHWWLVAAAIGLPILNWLITSAIFHVLMLPASRSPDAPGPTLGEMTLLIGSAWLLNYLPLSPGMIGRVAYHRAVHRIPVKVSVGVLAAALVIAMLVVALLLAMIFIAGDRPAATYLWLLAAPTPALFLLALGARALGNGLWRYPAAAALRWLDTLVWMARYAVLFALLGRTLTLPQAAAIAAASQAAMQVPIVGNGLGVREWAVGLVAPVLPSWMNAASAGLTRGLGLSADLLNRGFELAAALPVGLLCTALLGHRHLRQAPAP